jgi:hypothetical protein
MRNIKMSRTNAPKEIYVKVMPLSPGKSTEFNLTRLKEEYDKEGTEIRSWNIFSGGGIGASIGLIACLSSSVFGVPVTSPEAFTIVVGSLIFGIVAGFILY